MIPVIAYQNQSRAAAAALDNRVGGKGGCQGYEISFCQAVFGQTGQGLPNSRIGCERRGRRLVAVQNPAAGQMHQDRIGKGSAGHRCRRRTRASGHPPTGAVQNHRSPAAWLKIFLWSFWPPNRSQRHRQRRPTPVRGKHRITARPIIHGPRLQATEGRRRIRGLVSRCWQNAKR